MTPFVEAYVSEFEKRATLDAIVADWKAGKVPGYTSEQDIKDEIERCQRDYRTYRNDTYQVAVRDFGSFVHLSIKRNDRESIHDWRHLQQIKNELVGAECEGVELYPAESRKVDSANQYHLWVMKDPTFRFPVGFNERLVTDEPLYKSKNRPFDG